MDVRANLYFPWELWNCLQKFVSIYCHLWHAYTNHHPGPRRRFYERRGHVAEKALSIRTTPEDARETAGMSCPTVRAPLKIEELNNAIRARTNAQAPGQAAKTSIVLCPLMCFISLWGRPTETSVSVSGSKRMSRRLNKVQDRNSIDARMQQYGKTSSMPTRCRLGRAARGAVYVTESGACCYFLKYLDTAMYLTLNLLSFWDTRLFVRACS